jgi:hypothetical protein
MPASHNGKIARLPHLLREEIHTRLRDGQPAKQIVAWLNALAEVKAMLASAFGARPISEDNLSKWRKRAHKEWLLQEAALSQTGRFLDESRQLAEAGQGAITDHLATYVAARYALARGQIGDAADPQASLKLLRNFCHDVVALRRGDHFVERMRIKRDFQKLHLLNTAS